MAQRKSERMLNLMYLLFEADRYLTREEIRQGVAGYALFETEDAFLRAFERDKQELRQAGVVIESGSTDPLSDERDGYRLLRAHAFLPQITLTPEESTVLGLAASVWSEPSVAAQVGRAMTKLRGAGVVINRGGLSFLAPRVTAREPAFPLLWEAVLDRVPVSFVYHGVARVVHPWRMISRSGAWYLLGEDQGRGPRLFRASRIEGVPTLAGEPGSYTLPAPQIIAEHAARLDPPTPTQTVLLGLKHGAAGELRQREVHHDEETRDEDATRPASEVPQGYDLVRVAYARADEIVSAICAAGPDALVLQPGPIRDEVIAGLRGVVRRSS